MKKIILILFVFALQMQVFAQLTVEKIMRDPVWIGISPSEVRWSEDSKQIYFEWKTEKDAENIRYQTDFQGNNLQKLDKNIEKNLPNPQGKLNKDRSKKLYVKHGDIFLLEIATNKITQITNTSETESDPNFLSNDKIVFQRNLNLFVLNLRTAYLEQITDFVRGSEPKSKAKTEGEKWLENDQLNWFQILKERNQKRKKDAKEAEDEKPKRPTKIYLEDKNISLLQLSPNEKFVSYRLSKFIENVPTKVPNYVTESGYTEDLPTRAKVGTEAESSEFWIADLEKNTYAQLNLDSLTGLYDPTDFEKERNITRKTPRKVVVNGIFWSDDSKKAVAVIRSFDNKDRWIAAVDFAKKTVQTLDRQRDEAWIGGACIGSWYLQTGDLGWINSENICFVSEQTGYSHLYTLNVQNLQKKAITQGNFEVRKVQISADKRKFYFVSSEVHAGEDHLYVCDIDGKNKVQLTQMTGGHEVFISPNEQQIAFLYSYSNKPWELFVMENKANAKSKQITSSLTEEFKNYAWRDPQIITFKANDGKEVFARLYKPKPENDKKAGVIFVHGAGYLQNAHKHWSSYFREYMFHNLLTDKGFTVLDIDYRGSAGYGRDWRTGIYRFMGGQDLNDHIDGAKYLVEKHGVDAKKLGIYGGSYGGFITLMAMFTKPDVFAAGAALRSVTDWAHYNHGYTNNILNTPAADSLSFAKSSPIYYAEGLKGALLICHGMIDTNVHFQDVVRLAQRLIELKKENWEFAVYPLEDHGFVEPSSWTDEYKRILKLFETHLK